MLSQTFQTLDIKHLAQNPKTATLRIDSQVINKKKNTRSLQKPITELVVCKQKPNTFHLSMYMYWTVLLHNLTNLWIDLAIFVS